jgi:hypothetical protein
MLSPNNLSLLYKIISDGNQTFEEISNIFNAKFSKDSQNKAATCLLILLEDNLLNMQQKIISYFILYNMSKNEGMEINPFLSFILERLRKSNDKIEQNFLIDFLCNQINYLNLTIDKYLKENKKEQRINTTQIQMQWNKYYKEILRKKNIKINEDDKTRPIVYDRKDNDIKNVDSKANINIAGNINQNDKNEINDINLNLNYYKSNYMSFYPMNNSYFSAEPIWLIPNLKHNFIWNKK